MHSVVLAGLLNKTKPHYSEDCTHYANLNYMRTPCIRKELNLDIVQTMVQKVVSLVKRLIESINAWFLLSNCPGHIYLFAIYQLLSTGKLFCLIGYMNFGRKVHTISQTGGGLIFRWLPLSLQKLT